MALSRAGFCLAWVCGNLEYGAHLVDRALLINPNLATGWWNRGAISGFIGLHERSLEEVGRALRLSPIEPGVFQWHTAVSCSHFFLGNAEEAVKWSAKALAGRPNYIAALAANVVANVAAQNLGEAHNSLTRLLSIAPLLRIANLPAIVPFKGPSDYARFVGSAPRWASRVRDQRHLSVERACHVAVGSDASSSRCLPYVRTSPNTGRSMSSRHLSAHTKCRRE